MRITLRNLLAFLHGTLDAEQHATFAQLVQSNPRVQLLVDRCRHLAARRLAAPDLDQTHTQYQVNSVANYLDFTLPDDQLAAFEKAALASDEQLAEIVDCHRVLADVIKHRTKAAAPNCRERLLKLAEHAQEPVLVGAASSAPSNKKGQSDFASVRDDIKADLQDSGDLTEYLSDVDDEEELSLDTIQNRAKAVEKRAMAAAAQSYTAGGGAVTAIEAARALVHQQEEAYQYESPIEEASLKKKQPLPTPVLAGIGGGGVLVLGILLWVGSMLFAGKDTQAQGEPFYGIAAAPGKTLCEMRGLVQFQPAGASPSPDAGAIIIAWPVNPAAEANRLTTSVLLEDLAARRQNPYNDADFPLRQYDKILFHPKNAIPVDFESDNQLFVIPVEDVVAVFRREPTKKVEKDE